MVSSDTSSLRDFQSELQSHDIIQRVNSDINPSVSHKHLHDILNYLVDKYFPIKYMRFNKYKHKKSPWVTNGLLKSISYKDKLYIKLKSTSL